MMEMKVGSRVRHLPGKEIGGVIERLFENRARVAWDNEANTKPQLSDLVLEDAAPAAPDFTISITIEPPAEGRVMGWFDSVRAPVTPEQTEAQWIDTAAAALLVDLRKQGGHTTAPDGYEQPIEGCRRYASTLAGEVKEFLREVDRMWGAMHGFRSRDERFLHACERTGRA